MEKQRKPTQPGLSAARQQPLRASLHSRYALSHASPPTKDKTKIFLIGKKLKTKDFTPYHGGIGGAGNQGVDDRPESITMTCSLPRSRTAVTVVGPGLAVSRLHDDVFTDELPRRWC